MTVRSRRVGALLLGLALVLSAGPAAASTVATDTAGGAQASPQQAAAKQLFVRGSEVGPYRPGDEVRFDVYVQNTGPRQEEFVLTLTLPPELTLTGLGSGDLAPMDCSGNVCRGIIGPRTTEEADNARWATVTARLSPAFRGTTSTVRADLQEDANPDPSQRTTTVVVSVAPPAGGGDAAAPSSTGTGATGGLQTLPRTGDRTTVTALLALCLLLLGAIAQLMGTRRPAAHGR